MIRDLLIRHDSIWSQTSRKSKDDEYVGFCSLEKRCLWKTRFRFSTILSPNQFCFDIHFSIVYPSHSRSLNFLIS